MIRVILDSSSLITASKFSVEGQPVIKHLLRACEITLTPAVGDEVVVAGRSRSDASVVKELIDSGSIQVIAPSLRPSLLLDCFVLLVENGSMERDLTGKLVDAVAPRYGSGFVFHTLTMLKAGDRTCLM